MKKSEMIKLLINHFDYSHNNPEIQHGSEQAMFESILDFLELQGMEPPYNNGDVLDPNEWSPE